LILGKLIEKTEKRFKAAGLHYGHGTDNAHDEAAFLVLRGLGLPFDSDLGKDVSEGKVEDLIRQRIRERIPVAYLLNESWLDGVRFYVDERVIIPRSHIAFLLKGLKPPRRVLDLCTGSGCLAVLAAMSFPRAMVTASDVDRGVLEVARRNIARHRLQRRIRLVRSDLFDGVAGRYDLIVANPPYVNAAAMKRLPPEYSHEPPGALAGGQDGLFLVKKIIRKAESRLQVDGMLLCEVGDSRRALVRVYPELPFKWPHASVFALRRAEMG
jgi:ribosomal protein L3 glutamine methyltransferase